jgi:DNA-binding transcriptional ArsR family regulator
MSLPAVTKHLKMLERAKLISRSENAQWRPCRLEEHGQMANSSWRNSKPISGITCHERRTWFLASISQLSSLRTG